MTHLQYNNGQLMPHELLKRKDIFKKPTYYHKYPIAIVSSAVKELLKFSDITRTLYTHLQVVNIAYVSIHRTGKYGLAICDWN